MPGRAEPLDFFIMRRNRRRNDSEFVDHVRIAVDEIRFEQKLARLQKDLNQFKFNGTYRNRPSFLI